jgi:beta-lactamase regulating signal transducer with metallopeptidase domain
VLQRAERTEYAEQLVLLARRLASAPAPSTLGMANRSHLAERVSAILDPGLRRGRVGLTTTVSVMSAAALVALAIAPVSAVAVIRAAGEASVASAGSSSGGQHRQRL